MPLIYSQTIDQFTRLAVWQIAETEDFFLEKVPLSRSITHPHKRLQHLAGRYILQEVCPEFPIHLIQIADTNKPYLENESHHFSISHCGHFAAAIVSTTHRVGIDVEQPTARVNRIVHKFISDEENTWLIEAGLSNDDAFTTLLWSMKESLFKWYGLGEVDFKTQLQIKSIDRETQTAHALFSKSDLQKRLLMHYQFIAPIWLSWVIG